MTEIRFDDIESLSERVSEEYGDWGEPREITQEMIDQFAEVTGDHQWIHVDVERAKKESPFGAPIAHGFLTLSLLPALPSPAGFDLVGFGNATNYGSDKLRFLSPVPAGSKVRGRHRIERVEARKHGTLVVRENEIGIVGQEKPALIYTSLTLYHPPA